MRILLTPSPPRSAPVCQTGGLTAAPQFIEAGWLLALSVLLIAATVWLVRHRAA
jgi:hypothetical protein